MTDHSTVHDELPNRRAAAIDLSVAIAFFLACSAAEPVMDPLLRQGRGLTGVLALAGYQFACEDLALLFIMIVRHERLSSYGISRRNAGKSVALGLALAGINDLAMSWHAGALLWIPLRRHSARNAEIAKSISTVFSLSYVLSKDLISQVWRGVRMFPGTRHIRWFP